MRAARPPANGVQAGDWLCSEIKGTHCGRASLMEVRSDMRTVSKRSGTS